MRPFLGLIVALVVVGCADAPIPPSATPTAAPTLAVVALEPTPEPRCPDFAFDAGVPLGPEFERDIFMLDESEAITRDFLDGLAQIYERAGTVDPCRWFTERGWRTAIVADPRLRDVDRGESRIEGGLVLRNAFEGTYDLRELPPTVPIDAVFDIVAGATITDLPSHTATITAVDERVGLHIDFVYDGHEWRANQVGPISADHAVWATLPTPLPPGAPCSDFERDRGKAAFDDHAGEGRRSWCDADGRGRRIRQTDQLSLFTRYPCNTGHAAILTIGDPLGTPVDNLARNEFVRDPAGEFLAEGWLTAPYQGKATLPDDAAYTGWTNGNIELWLSPSEFDRAIYIKRGDAIERWPRAAKDWGVIDCN